MACLIFFRIMAMIIAVPDRGYPESATDYPGRPDFSFTRIGGGYQEGVWTLSIRQ